MKKTVIASFVVACALVNMANAQDSTKADNFKPSGKVEGKIYADYHATFTQVDNNGKTQNEQYSAFEVTRAYFGYGYHFSDKLSGNVKLDVGKDDISTYTAYLKSAGLTWKASKQFTVKLGLIDTYEFKLQEGFWGKRYLYNSFQDKYHFGSSADDGLALLYKFNNKVKLDFAVLNGDGYKHAQDINGQFQFAGGLTITPIKGLYIRGYYDGYSIASTDSGRLANQTTLATFVGYKTSKFSIGAEYNMQNNHGSIKDHNLSGESFYAEYWASKKVGIFARYDGLGSNKVNSTDTDTWNTGGSIGHDGSALLGGVEYKAAKGVAISLNYQGWTPSKSTFKPITSTYLSLQYAW